MKNSLTFRMRGRNINYERIRKETEEYTVKYIVTGGGGAQLGGVDDPPDYEKQDKAVQEAWYAENTPAGNEDAYHFCVIDIDGSSLEFDMYKWNGDWKDGFQLP